MVDIGRIIGDWFTGGGISAAEGEQKRLAQESQDYEALKSKLGLQKDQDLSNAAASYKARQGIISQTELDTIKAYNNRVNEAVKIVTGGQAKNIRQMKELYVDNTQNITSSTQAIQKILDSTAKNGIDLLSDSGKQYAKELQTSLKEVTGGIDKALSQSSSTLSDAVNSSIQTLSQAKESYAPYTKMGQQATQQLQDIQAGKYNMQASPTAQYALQQGQQAQSRSSRAAGNYASSASQNNDAQLRASIAAQDYQNTINNAMQQAQTGLTAIQAQSQLSEKIGDQQANLGANLANLIMQGTSVKSNYLDAATKLIANNNLDINSKIIQTMSSLGANSANLEQQKSSLERGENTSLSQGIIGENSSTTNALFGVKQNQGIFESSLASNTGQQNLANLGQKQGEESAITNAYNTNMNNAEINHSNSVQKGITDMATIQGTSNIAGLNSLIGVGKAIVTGGASLLEGGSNTSSEKAASSNAQQNMINQSQYQNQAAAQNYNPIQYGNTSSQMTSTNASNTQSFLQNLKNQGVDQNQLDSFLKQLGYTKGA